MTRQRQIEELLGRIRADIHELELLRVRGARGRALAERERELSRVREQLAQLVAHAGERDAPTTRSTGRTALHAAPSGRSRRSLAHAARPVASHRHEPDTQHGPLAHGSRSHAAILVTPTCGSCYRP